MKKLIIGMIALLAIPSIAFAQTVDTTGLTPQQVAEIQAQVEAKRSETPEGQVRASIARANEWVDIGEGIGAGVAAAARETGQVVNEFAQTPVGKMTTFVILYKVVGKDIIGLIVGTIAIAVFTTIWLIYTYSAFSKEKRIRVEDKVKTIQYTDRSWSDGRAAMAFLSVVVFLFVNGILLGTVVL